MISVSSDGCGHCLGVPLIAITITFNHILEITHSHKQRWEVTHDDRQFGRKGDMKRDRTTQI